MRIISGFAILLFVLSKAAWAGATDWPQLEQVKDSSHCAEAFKIAHSLYSSKSFYLYDLPIIQEGVGSNLVLKPSALDISIGDAIIADQAVFDKIPKSDRSIFWQRQSSSGLRWVLYEDSFGWRGDQYSLFALKDDVTSTEFIKKHNRDSVDSGFTPLIVGNWRPPLIFQEKTASKTWVIGVGAPHVFLSDWQIYSIGPDGAKRRCTIRFYPEAETATALLPSPVYKLAALLDGTIGSGKDEGTLNPTASIRVKTMHTWANVAMRPWALSQEPYNTREKVDAELKKWSLKSPSFGTLYNNIIAQYPKAERSLEQYYKAHFNKTTDEAKALTKQALDFAFRSYFVFPASN